MTIAFVADGFSNREKNITISKNCVMLFVRYLFNFDLEI